MAILGFLTILWLGPKDTEPRATLVPKAKLGHTESRAPSVPKVKLGHSNCVRHWVILSLVMAILGFLIIPWLGPKDTEPRATSVPKAKLGHTELRGTLVLYVSRLVWYWFSRFFEFTAFLVPSVEPVLVGIHDF